MPFGAGSATDIVIRIVGDEMRHELGQQIVVENKPGAFGILALEDRLKTPPDVLETIHKATVAALKSAPVQEAFKKQMIKAVPNATIADAKAWDVAERAYWKKLTQTVKVEKPE